MKSFMGWIGGKNLLRKEIVRRFPSERYDFYIEVFGGAAWVLFEKSQGSEAEIYNDINGDLVNLFRCIKYHCTELHRELQFVLNSREIFENYRDMNTNGMTDIQRAARFFLIVKTSYGAKVKGGSFGCIKKDISSMIAYLSEIQNRLQKVIIENKDFEALINSFCSKKSLFYLDPPYFGSENYYMAQFKRIDHERLYNCLYNIKSHFILTYNDCDYIRDLYKGFTIIEIDRDNSLSTKQQKSRYKELIIMNY